MKLVYINSPIGIMENGDERAKDYCAQAVQNGCIPLSPQLLFSYLDDNSPEDCSLRVQMDLALIPRCDEMWICGDAISPHMQQRLDCAIKNKVAVKHITI